MKDVIILLTIIICAGGLGMFFGHALATYRSNVTPLPLFDLSDEAIAHIAHEARRAYERSMGVIKLRSWNNLGAEARNVATARIAAIRSGARASIFSFAHRIELAVVGLVHKL